jgi:hypothetical protein
MSVPISPDLPPEQDRPRGAESGQNQASPFRNDVPGKIPTDGSPRDPTHDAWTLSLCTGLSVFFFLGMVPLMGLGGIRGPRDEWRIGIGLGLGFSVVSLAGLWTVFGPFRFFTRVPLAILLVAFSILALGAFFLADQGIGSNVEGAILVAITAALQWMGLVGLFTAARAATGSILMLPGTTLAGGNRKAQFGIRQILIWTTGVAIFLAILRLVISRFMPGGLNWSAITRESSAFALLLGFNLVVTCSIAWAILSRGNLVLRLAAAIVLVLLATWLEHPAFRAVLGPGGEAAIFWWINGAGSLCLVVNLFIVRLCGYRLMRDER